MGQIFSNFIKLAKFVEIFQILKFDQIDKINLKFLNSVKRADNQTLQH